MDPSTKVEVLRACCCIAGADGKCNEQETRLLERMAGEIGVGKASLGAMIERAETDKEFYKQHFQILKAEPTQALAILFQMAVEDGAVVEEEVAMLQALANNLEVPQDIFDQVKTAAIGQLPR